MRWLSILLPSLCMAFSTAGASPHPNPFGDPDVLEAECAADNFESCSKLANYLTTRNTEETKARAVTIHAATCDKGHLPSCGDLAASYSLGLGVEKDEQRAYQIDLELCEEKDYAPACGSIGFVHALGKAGFEKDDNRALPYFARGCELGDAGSCQRAGQHWYDLLNPARDLVEARAYFERGCEMGDRYACNDLNRMPAAE